MDKKYKETGNLERSPDSDKNQRLMKIQKTDNPNARQKELGQLYAGAS